MRRRVPAMVRFIEKNGGIKSRLPINRVQVMMTRLWQAQRSGVATNGNDSASGTESAPYKTIGKAKEAVRSMISSGNLLRRAALPYI